MATENVKHLLAVAVCEHTKTSKNILCPPFTRSWCFSFIILQASSCSWEALVFAFLCLSPSLCLFYLLSFLPPTASSPLCKASWWPVRPGPGDQREAQNPILFMLWKYKVVPLYKKKRKKKNDDNQVKYVKWWFTEECSPCWTLTFSISLQRTFSEGRPD